MRQLALPHVRTAAQSAHFKGSIVNKNKCFCALDGEMAFTSMKTIVNRVNSIYYVKTHHASSSLRVYARDRDLRLHNDVSPNPDV